VGLDKNGIELLKQEVQNAERETHQAMQDLNRNGGQVDGIFMLNAKLEAFIAFALGPDNEEGELQFQLRFQQHLLESIKEAHSVLNKLKLQAPLQPHEMPKGII